MLPTAGYLDRVIDVHSHVLPGIDDGPATVEGSLALARAAQAQGTTELVATPHIAWDLPNDARTVREGVGALQAELDAAGIALRLRTGGEVVITRAAELDDAELAGLRLGGGEWLLAECPLGAGDGRFDALLLRLQERGHRILLAHPERSPAIQRRPELLGRLVEAGMLCSITAGSLVGRFGSTVQRFTHTLLEEGLVHNVASDAHDAVRRSPAVLDALEEADRDLPGLAEHVGWLTVDVPRAVLDGGPVPPAPGPPPARRRRGLLRGASRRR